MLNLHRLRLLVELHRRGTIGAVAEALSYSPSSISQQLSQLQTETATALIEPVGRGVALTAAGQILVRHAEEMLRRIERAEADLAALRADIVGTLKVASFQTAAIALIPDTLRIMGRRHPGLELYFSEIQPDAGTSALLAREFDLVLGEQYPGRQRPAAPGILRQQLFTDPLRLYTSRQGGGGRLEDFADAHWVFEPAGKPARLWAESACRAAGFEPDVRFESADLFVHVQLVETGHATALLPDLVWGTRRPAGSFVDLAGTPTREVYTAVRAGAETRPALVELRNVLLEAAAQLAEADHPASAADEDGTRNEFR